MVSYIILCSVYDTCPECIADCLVGIVDIQLAEYILAVCIDCMERLDSLLCYLLGRHPESDVAQYVTLGVCQRCDRLLVWL